MHTDDQESTTHLGPVLVFGSSVGPLTQSLPRGGGRGGGRIRLPNLDGCGGQSGAYFIVSAEE